MPEEPAADPASQPQSDVHSQPLANPFSLVGGTFGNKSRFGAFASSALWPTASAIANTFGFASAQAAGSTSAAAKEDEEAAKIQLEVKVVGVEAETFTISVPADATVDGLAAAVRAERLRDDRPIALLFAGQKLSCPSERLDALGIEDGASLKLMRVPMPETPPLNKRITVPPVQSAQSVALAPSPPAKDAAAAAAAAGSSGGSAGAAGGATLRMRFVSSRVFEVPYEPSMTGMGLKRLLEAKGEGVPLSFRLLCQGKEVMDNAGLALQKVGANAVVDVMRREVPLGASLASGVVSGTGNSLFSLGGGGGGASSAATGPRQGKFVGLRNQGNTCYLNSLIQSIYLTPSLSASIKGLAAMEGGPASLPPLTKALVDLFAALDRSPSAVSTQALTSALQWTEYNRQQDVNEFWTLLCDKLATELRGTPHATIVERLFQGGQRDYVTCCECGTTSYRGDVFEDLKLTVPTHEQAASSSSAQPAFSGVGRVLGSGAEAASSTTTTTTEGEAEAAGGAAEEAPPPPPPPPLADVEAALRELLRPEQMRGSEQYQCDCCGKKTDAERGVQLTRLPPVLALQLKRFQYDFATRQRSKINTKLAFDTSLDMAPFLSAVEDNEEEAAAAAAAAAGAADAEMGDEASKSGDGTASTHPPVPSGDEPHSAAHDEDEDNSAIISSPSSTSTSTPPFAARTKPRPPPCMYELYAVLMHSGSASFGHYYAYIKDVSSSEWYEFNDSAVTPIKQSDLQRAYGGGGGGYGASASAYMLLYRKVAAEAGAGGDGAAEEEAAAAAVARASSTPTPSGLARGSNMMSGGDGMGDELAHGTKRLRLAPPAVEHKESREPSMQQQQQQQQQQDALMTDAVMLMEDEPQREEEGNPYFF